MEIKRKVAVALTATMILASGAATALADTLRISKGTENFLIQTYNAGVSVFLSDKGYSYIEYPSAETFTVSSDGSNITQKDLDSIFKGKESPKFILVMNDNNQIESLGLPTNASIDNYSLDDSMIRFSMDGIQYVIDKSGKAYTVDSKGIRHEMDVKDLCKLQDQVSLYLTPEEVDKVQITTNTGAVDINGIKAKEIEIYNQDGSTTLMDVETSGLSAKSDNGIITAQNTALNDGIISTNQGMINLWNIDALDLSLQTESGTINANHVFARSIGTMATSGSTNLNNVIAPNIDALSKSGPIRIQTLNNGMGYIIHTKTKGDKDVDKSDKNGQYAIAAESKTGDIIIRTK